MNHTIDLVVTPQGGQMEAFLFVFAGIQHLLFHCTGRSARARARPFMR